MNTPCRRVVTGAALIVCCAVALLSPGDASGRNREAAFSFAADDQGIAISCNSARDGVQDISIRPGECDDVFSLLDFVRVRLCVEDIVAEQQTILVRCTVTVFGQGDVYDDVVPLPFAEIGIERYRTADDFAPVDGDDMLGISYLFTSGTFRYAVGVNFLGLYSDSWEGRADPRNNVIAQQVRIDTICLESPAEQEVPCYDLEADILLIPVFLLGEVLPIGVALDARLYDEGSLVQDISFPGDIPVIGDMLGAAPVPFPSGGYRLWLDLGFETVDDLIAWLQSIARPQQ